MAKPDKAQISFDVDGQKSVLRFHSVISEEHEASTSITQFPTQAGFVVSNTAIKKNRKITISGVVTNTVIETALENHQYSTNNARWMFDVLRTLVNKAIPCEVLTNLGTYNPVIFNRIKTKQAEGMTDALMFTILGEEVQVSEGDNDTSPVPLIFTPISPEERKAEVDKLLANSIIVKDYQEISVAKVNIGESFVVDTFATNGKPIQVTYEFRSFDAATGKHNYTVHTTDTEVVESSDANSLSMISVLIEEANELLGGVDLIAGASTASACLVDGLEGLVNDLVEDTINTAMGELTESIYGAIEDNFGFTSGSEFGELLIGLAVDCCVAGAIGAVDPTLVDADDFNDNDLITVDDAVRQAASLGDGAITGSLNRLAPTTLTKISSGTNETTFLGDLI